MKTIVRALVVVLALTGAAAATLTPAAASARTITASSSLKALPVPTCPPNTNDPNPCGIGTVAK